MKDFIWKYCFVFITLFIVTFEYTYSIFPDIYLFVNPFFENLVYWSGISIFNKNEDFVTTISSDSVGLYIHVFNLIFISGLLASLWQVSLKTATKPVKYWSEKIALHYLSLQLLLYGFNKVFKAQFYQAEPNILFTNLGDLTPDFLFWTATGSSWSYSFILGLIEVMVALFLLFPKTRLIGVISGIGVMIHVVLINFSYDISVKVYSTFLLSLFLILFIPYARYLYSALVLQKPIEPIKQDSIFAQKPKLRLALKTGIIILFLAESLTPYVKAGNYNDDLAQRPIFHGAYQVLDNSANQNQLNWKQVFIHRGGYFITKDENDNMQDYQLEVDTINQALHINRYDLNRSFILNYEEHQGNLIRLQGTINTSEIDIDLKLIDRSEIPLLNSEFHWTTEH